MRIVILRTIPAGLVFLAGVASLIYGTLYHQLTITAEEEIEVAAVPPPMFGPADGPPMDGLPGEPPGFAPLDLIGPPPFAANIKQTVIVENQQPERVVVREVSVGGVTLLESGELRRTYTGEPPALCPT
jgi:hypothetical protein